MPSLDVSFVVADPMLADRFTVKRRTDVVDNFGRTAPTLVETFANQVGVVTQQDPADLMRRDDGQMVPRMIFVASRFIFRGASVGYQPDIITWNGSDYTVKHVMNYSRYGNGIVEVVAESMVAMDNPQSGAP